jgi:hypothetical protein
MKVIGNNLVINNAFRVILEHCVNNVTYLIKEIMDLLLNLHYINVGHVIKCPLI